jgi:hypothetical protein
MKKIEFESLIGIYSQLQKIDEEIKELDVFAKLIANSDSPDVHLEIKCKLPSEIIEDNSPQSCGEWIDRYGVEELRNRLQKYIRSSDTVGFIISGNDKRGEQNIKPEATLMSFLSSNATFSVLSLVLSDKRLERARLLNQLAKVGITIADY